ncbi:hypothetical protein KCP74_12085 [Salmonella enterica subsp. enterica]|nr:hypothetical protein KCP74_12085 [Salmonella enterica subsp. enterica]
MRLKDFAERLLEDPADVSANPSTRERKKIHQWYYRADTFRTCCAVEAPAQTKTMQPAPIVFVRKRERVHELAETLRLAGSTIAILKVRWRRSNVTKV